MDLFSSNSINVENVTCQTTTPVSINLFKESRSTAVRLHENCKLERVVNKTAGQAQQITAPMKTFATLSSAFAASFLFLSNPATAAASQQAEAVTKETTEEAPQDDLFTPKKIDFPSADPVIGLVDARQTQSLNGDWNIIVDPMGVGDPGGFFGGFPPNKKNTTGMELVEYDFDKAQTVSVPGDWNSQDERLFFYQGRVWYHRKLQHKPEKGTRQHLYFGGANFRTEVFLNGQVIGAHDGGYVPFSFDVTDKLKDGENVVIVKVDNRLSDSSVPTKRTDWWPYGGLTRDVMLVETPDQFIRNAKISLNKNSTDKLAVTIEGAGYKAGTRAKVSLPELGVSKRFSFGADGKASVTFAAKPKLWSPENPKLYNVEFQVGNDTLIDKVGFRTIETQGTQILLNGKPIKLRGISTHEEPIGREGVAHSEADYKRLLTEAKALNANYVRAAHYPYSRHMAKAADEMGILLWEEIPVYWNIEWGNEKTLEVARDQMQRLVKRDWNRASVVVWSVANETPNSEPRMTFLRRLIDDTRNMDDTRLVSAALLGGGPKEFGEVLTHLAVRGLAKGGLSPKDEAIFKAIVARAGDKEPGPDDGLTLVIKDPLGEFTDIVSANKYYGWYYSIFFADQTGVGEDVLRPLLLDFIPKMKVTAAVNKPVQISEVGGGALAGNIGGEALIWTEEYQAKVYEANVAMVANSPQVQGLTPWILKDFRAMLRPLAGVQDYYNRKGLIDPNGKRKQAFDVLKDFYASDWAN